jgi:16S rRNA (guanine(966)-N(2))-methyltransferase RsmD
MRVISGIARGRRLKAVPGQSTRPTTDKVKESIFSMIGPYFEGGLVLDLFAGTGALGIEALSRGFERAVFIDIQPMALQVIKSNLEVTNFLDRADVYRNDAKRALKLLLKQEQQFDLVFMDPPYHMNMYEQLIVMMADNNLLAIDAMILCEHQASVQLPDQILNLSKYKTAVYGESAVTIYKK